MMEAFGISDPGRVRKGNEDSYVCNELLQLFVVADGMGGHSAGEVASRLAIEAVEGFIRRSHDDSDFSWPYGVDPQLSLGGNRLRTAVHLANRRVFRAAESCDDYTGMGTTLTAVLITGDRLAYGHVGDSRLYTLNGEGFRQITHDDSWVATILANDPNITPAELARHPMRHVLTNVLGAREQVEVQLAEFHLAPGAVFLLCSDGLHGMVNDAGLERILREGGPLDAMGRRLITAALEGGGHDNVTAVLIRTAAEP
ncbi:MAG TPA: PP2C family serine/threonine-protein phosphatase [Vicinamibacterales bacterium]|jgi:protein phosphatase